MLSEDGFQLTVFTGLLDIQDEDDVIDPANDINLHEEIVITEEKYHKLNLRQKNVVDFALRAVDDYSGKYYKCIYIDGPGDSGKTFVYRTLWHLSRSKGKTVCNMAFIGIAATLLPMGKTVHKVLGLSVPLYSDSSSSIKVQSKEGLYFKYIDVFILDKAPRAPKYGLEIMDRTLRYITISNIIFGGKIVILGGDIRQVLPIKERGTRSEKL